MFKREHRLQRSVAVVMGESVGCVYVLMVSGKRWVLVDEAHGGKYIKLWKVGRKGDM